MEILKRIAYGKLSKKNEWLAGMMVLTALILTGAWFLLPVNHWLNAGYAWFIQLGPWGAVLFLLLYIVAVVFLVPGSVLSIAAGLLYGFWGMPLAVLGATIGASLAFLIARYVAHDKTESWVNGRRRARAVMAAVNEGGWKIVGLVRLSPVIPFNLQNYFFGLTHISFWGYVAATFIGIIPGTVVNIYLGTVGDRVLNDSAQDNMRWGFFAVGLVITIIVTWLVTRKAKEKLAEAGVDVSANARPKEESAASKS